LLNFLQENENAMVEIQGHVNGPNSNNTNEFKKLSENRAEAVKSFLIENGISEKRLKANGYGNSKMLYPNPVTEGQHAANRRVEIVILKLK
jgi:outer membrane protein OmpA-like peptidoglycan-associated protein